MGLISPESLESFLRLINSSKKGMSILLNISSGFEAVSLEVFYHTVLVSEYLHSNFHNFVGIKIPEC